MNINRQNYEEWMLLYVDNELSLAERIIADDFLAANPDLQRELEILQQSTFQPDTEIVFQHKSALYKSEGSGITEANCEQFFVLYADNELTNEQQAEVEQFIYSNPQHQAAFELIQQAKLTPDQSIIFPNKKSLYRSEKERKVVAMAWWKIAAAAVLLLLIGGVSYKMLVKSEDAPPVAELNNGKGTEQSSGIASNDSAKEQQQQTPSVQPYQLPEAPADEKQIAAGSPTKAATAITTQTADRGNKSRSSSQIAIPVIPAPTPVTSNERYRINPASPRSTDLALNQPENKSGEISNNKVASSVLPTEPASLKVNEQPGTGKIAATSPGINTAINSNDMAAVAVPSYDLNSSTDEELMPAPSKKGKMRGLLRKVSRVFEKATNADDENHKGNIRIANFEIALK